MSKEEKEGYMKEKALEVSKSIIDKYENCFSSTELKVTFGDSWFGSTTYGYIYFEDHDDLSLFYTSYKITVGFDSGTGNVNCEPSLRIGFGHYNVPFTVPIPFK